MVGLTRAGSVGTALILGPGRLDGGGKGTIWWLRSGCWWASHPGLQDLRQDAATTACWQGPAVADILARLFIFRERASCPCRPELRRRREARPHPLAPPGLPKRHRQPQRRSQTATAIHVWHHRFALFHFEIRCGKFDCHGLSLARAAGRVKWATERSGGRSWLVEPPSLVKCRERLEITGSRPNVTEMSHLPVFQTRASRAFIAP